MKILGNDVHIQKGEIWSLDFDVTNNKGDPYMIFKGLRNPYMVITVTLSRYEQSDNLPMVYWLDLDKVFVEKSNGKIELEDLKRFGSTEALFTTSFDIPSVLARYGVEEGGKIVLDPSSEFDITNFLFFTDPLSDGKRVYKYVAGYTLSGDTVTDVTWAEYKFRIIKQFITRDWPEQSYLFDVKVVSGESLNEHIANVVDLGIDISLVNEWSNNEIQEHIDMITDTSVRKEMQTLYDNGAPLMPTLDTASLILPPTRLYVGANIQGGIK